MNRLKVVVVGILAAAVASAYPVGGWGGLGVTGMTVEVEGLADSLTTINQEILGGSQTIEFGTPFYLIGGQGGGEMGIFSLGAWGGGLFKRAKADRLTASLGYAAGSAELGVHWKPVEFVWIRPYLDAGGAVFALELRDIRETRLPEQEPYQSSFKGWQINLGGGLALQLNIPIGKRSLVGLMVQTGYLYPAYTVWRDKTGLEIDPIEGFGLHGLYLRAGINFGSRKALPKVE
jgi:hypothetical protein